MKSSLSLQMLALVSQMVYVHCEAVGAVVEPMIRNVLFSLLVWPQLSVTGGK